MYNDALEILKSYAPLGEKKLEDGTLLIGRAPHIAPMAWLHSIYAPLSFEDIYVLENQLHASIPEVYKDFLSISNGVGVFNTTLSLYGYRRNYIRDIINVWQPFDILTPNIYERPQNATNDLFFIGSYYWDGSLLYIHKGTNKIHYCQRDNAISLFEWPSFNEMLESEIKRLTTIFDAKGKRLQKGESTLPI